MAVNVQRSDLYVGLFLVAVVALVVIALVATSGWGVARYDVFVRTDNTQDVAVDTKVYMQGLEVGRVAGIAPRPVGSAGQLEFIVRLSLLDRFPDGTPLRLPRATTATVAGGLLGAAQLQLTVRADTGGTLGPGDTIAMSRGSSPVEAFTSLAMDLKGTLQNALVSATATMNSARGLVDSMRVATGTARRFLVATQPGAEKAIDGVVVNLDRLRSVLDSTNSRSGVTLAQVNSTLTQSRILLSRVDTLTGLLISMGGENRPEIAQIITNFRRMSAQLGYVLEQLSRRPLRFITGVKIPDSLSIEGQRADSMRRAAASRSDSPPPSTPRPPSP